MALEHKLRDMSAQTRVLETTLDRASKLVEDLSAYVANLAGPGSGVAAFGGGVAAEEYLMFKASQEHAMASICQELNGGGIMLGGIEFDGKDACIAFAWEHLTGDLTYHCIPSLMYALCMTSEKVVYNSDMQSDEIHAARTARNPMQSAVVLSVNTMISTPPRHTRSGCPRTATGGRTGTSRAELRGRLNSSKGTSPSPSALGLPSRS